MVTKKGMFGKSHSKASKDKIRVAHKGKHYSPSTEFKKGMISTRKGKTQIAWNKGKRNPHFAKEKNPNWKGGISNKNRLIRRSPEFREWREKVFARDEHTCRACGEKGGLLHPHHVNEFARFPELRFNINNGVTLHPDCHKHIHQMEKMNDIERHSLKGEFL